MTNKNISVETKTQILSESFIPGCVISKLASNYGISAKTIYNWRKAYRSIAAREAETDDHNLFVELSVSNKEQHILKKSELIFNDIILSIEGNINSSHLVAIIRILESC